MVSTAFSYAQIYQFVLQIPRGRVATYGQIAKLAGLPNGARLVGYALSALGENSLVPWHRIVIQRIRLEREGVVFDASGRIRLSEFRWIASENR